MVETRSAGATTTNPHVHAMGRRKSRTGRVGAMRMPQLLVCRGSPAFAWCHVSPDATARALAERSH
jgi:hypothetical protein